ncbi:MAG: hypothetical protein R3B13_11655 [Polyangiaceae bacterium]
MTRLSCEVPFGWEHVREVRTRLADSLADQPAELRDAAVMVASELVENAIKYGNSLPNAPNATLELLVDDKRLQIVVRNGVSSAEHASEVEKLLQRIASAQEPSELYMERMERLLNDADAKGKLGFHRIGLEAGFVLTSSFEDGVLTITATRRISS